MTALKKRDRRGKKLKARKKGKKEVAAGVQVGKE